MKAAGNESARFDVNGNLGLGTKSPDAKLAVNGDIHAHEVRVDMNVLPDYVFTQGYDLPTIKEVRAYIEQNHHLPEVPSAQQVAKEGLNLGEMNAILLKKIEELTLYIIESDKKMELQYVKSTQQDARIAALEKTVVKPTNASK